jgi:hypothetical protein
VAGSQTFKLNRDKIIKSISLALLYVKGDYYLEEYVQTLRKALEMALPTSLIKGSVAESSPSSNLFEHNDQQDLSLLKGQAILIPSASLLRQQPNQQSTLISNSDSVIKLLHSYYSQEFQFCGNSADKRLDVLFEIKDRWTQQELSQYLRKFIEIGQNLDAYLMKNTRIVKDKNPFDASKDIVYYLKKF